MSCIMDFERNIETATVRSPNKRTEAGSRYPAVLILFVSVLLVLGGCIGDKEDNQFPLDTYYYYEVSTPTIEAELFTFPTGSAPANFKNAVVHVYLMGRIVQDAAVSINGVALAFDSGHGHYQGDVNVAPGETATLQVTTGGKTYTASGSQFSSFPAISAPTANEVWSTFYDNTIRWSGGAPALSGGFYALRIVDSADPDYRVWPTDTLLLDVSLSSTGYTLYGQEGVENRLWGDRLLLVGIAQRVPISGASSDSEFVISGANYVPVSFRYELPDPNLAQAVRYPEPGGMNLELGDTAIGDLNGDTHKDVATFRRFNGKGEILVYLYSQTTGSLTVPTSSLSVDLYVTGITVADVNGDGLNDLIVSGNSTTTTGGRIAIFTQNAGTFNPPVISAVPMAETFAIASGDLNHDNNVADVVVVGQDAAGNGVVQFLFQSGGSLSPALVYTNSPVFTSGGPASQVRIWDMNHDTYNDVVLQSRYDQIAVIKQKPSAPGAFDPPVFYNTSISGGFSAFNLGDLNNDGRTDLIVVDPMNDGYMKMFLQASDGTLAPPMSLHVSFQAQDEVEIADMNHDGLNDLIFVSSGYRIQVMYQNAGHSFGHPLTSYFPVDLYGGANEFHALSVGDVNGDGLPDIVYGWLDEGIYVMPQAQ